MRWYTYEFCHLAPKLNPLTLRLRIEHCNPRYAWEVPEGITFYSDKVNVVCGHLFTCTVLLSTENLS